MSATATPKNEKAEGFDPLVDYDIRSLNPDYSGTSAGVKFEGGHARLYALSSKATEEEKAARLELLQWFINCGERAVRSEVVVDEDTGETKVVVRRGQVYTISRWER